jgi:Tol biopolymer transport system component
VIRRPILFLFAGVTAAAAACAHEDPVEPRTASPAGFPSPPRPAGPLDRRVIAFSKGDRRASNIWVARANGTGARALTHGRHGFRYDPDWSRSGKRLLLRFEPGRSVTGASYVMRINVDGSHPLNLSKLSGFGGSAASWSPDGRIVFGGARLRQRLGPNRIYVMNGRGSGVRRLTPRRLDAQYPAWSPDGRIIAFIGIEGVGPGGEVELYRIRPDGSGLRALTHGRGMEGWPMWSRDSRRIAFDRDGRTWLVNADGIGERPLRGVNRTGCGVPGNWSPGDRLVLNCRRGMAAMRLDGSGFMRLLSGRPGEGFPAWRP